ncbi:MAG: T9SS type A sorting domain-containing protein [Chitinophagales bacterium]|nr:T9SS type A sorting domain-containing protein [Chitinophagales bacterium]
MNNIILFVLLGCLDSLLVYGQYYQKSILLQGDFAFQEAAQVINVNDTLYTVLIHPRMDTDDFYHSGLLFTDSKGTVIDTVFFREEHTNYAATDILPNELGYGILVTKDPDNYGSLPGYPVFLQVDSLGNILYAHEAVDTINYKVVEQMVRTPEDGGYLAVGRVIVNNVGRYKPYLIKFSYNGTKQWEKIITDYPSTTNHLFWDVVRSTSGEYYACGVNILVEDEIAKILLARIDINNGSVVQDWNYNIDPYSPNNQSYCGGMKLIALNDGGILIGAQSEGELRTGILMRLNNNKDTMWVNIEVLNDCGPRELLYMPSDGSFVTTGCATVLYPEVSDGVQVEISKVSSSGVLLWKRHYGVDGRDDYAWGMTAAPDGGFMVVGRTYDFATQQVPIYLLKTNCMGLLTEPEASFSTTASTTALTTAFQNLSQFVYPDSTDGGHFIWEFGDGTAPQINNAAFVSHTFPAYGTYTVRLTAVVCSDTSVVEQVVGVFPVGLPQIGMGGFSVYPNPAQDHLVVQNHNQEQSATFILYDVLGRQVLSFTPNNQSVVPINHLPSGVYLYQFINPQNQILAYGKVSVVR